MTANVHDFETTAERPIGLLAYFRQVYDGRVEQTPEGIVVVPLTDVKVREETLHLAWSRDAFHWTPLNDNKSVWPEQFVRDPFVARGADGWFRLVGTGNGGSTKMLYARSRDLISWEDVRFLSGMDNVEGARNVWAPEFVFDAARGDYLVYWSSSHGKEGWDDSRIWCARTRDFQSLSEPRVLLDPGYTVIDASIVQHDGTFQMFVKDERFGYLHGEHRFIQIATAPHLDGPYEVVTEAITPQLSEGPFAFWLEERQGWMLIYDRCMENRYEALFSRDLQNWEEQKVQFPLDARHASVLRISEAELETLQEKFGA